MDSFSFLFFYNHLQNQPIMQNNQFRAFFFLSDKNLKINCCTSYFGSSVRQLTFVQRVDWVCPARLAPRSSGGLEYRGLARHVAFLLTLPIDIHVRSQSNRKKNCINEMHETKTKNLLKLLRRKAKCKLEARKIARKMLTIFCLLIPFMELPFGNL